nr:hypothetical protein [Nocardia crassostreae]
MAASSATVRTSARISSSARRPDPSILASNGRVRSSAPACAACANTTIPITSCAITSCSSRAICARSPATAARRSATNRPRCDRTSNPIPSEVIVGIVTASSAIAPSSITPAYATTEPTAATASSPASTPSHNVRIRDATTPHPTIATHADPVAHGAWPTGQ